MFLAVHAFHFLRAYGTYVGFDADSHLSHLASVSWHAFLPDIHSGFYAYHPPLGFLLPHTLVLLGFEGGKAVQVFSFAASLVSFFCLRAALRKIGWLGRPLGIAFLYVASALPVNVHLSAGINLDILLQALASALILLSVSIFPEPPATRGARIGSLAGIGALLCVGMAIKFNGLLLFGIPPLAAGVASLRRRRWQPLAAGIAVSVVSGLLVLPFYYQRYYRVEGTFFPNNADMFEAEKIAEARAKRDKDPLAYLGNMLLPNRSPENAEPAFRDYQVMRISDTWRDVWSGDTVRVPYAGRFTRAVERFYLLVMPAVFWLACAGLALRTVRTLRRKHADAGDRAWLGFGVVLLGFGLAVWAALLYYMYTVPFPDWRTGKAIYLGAAIPSLAWLLVHAWVPVELLADARGKTFRTAADALLLALAAAFLAVNHMVPVY